MQNIILSTSVQAKKELNVKLIEDDAPGTDPVHVLVRVRGDAVALNRAQLHAFIGALQAADTNWPA